MRSFLHILFYLFSCLSLSAQEPWVIEKILLPDDLYTKSYVILRELPGEIGDTLYDWASFQQRSQSLLLNTGLFKEVQINRDEEEGELQLLLKESLFILPIPFIELADRNLNEWWVTHNHDIERLNLGLNLYHVNLTGRNDPLKLTVQFGFIQKYYASYYFPYFGKDLSWQPYVEGIYANQKEIPISTIGNKQNWYGNPEQILLERYRFTTGIRFRPHWNTTFAWELSFFQNKVGTDILEMSPLFINNATGTQKYLQASLIYDRDFRNVRVYPTAGHKIKSNLTWNGLSKSLNTLFMDLESAYWHAWDERLSSGVQLIGRKYLYKNILPFYQARALGYGNKYVRGYEYYVVDGSDHLLIRSDVKVQILDRNWDWGSMMFIRPLRNMPLELYVNLYADAGKVRAWEFATNNFLDEDWLVGYGLGLDVLLYRNFVFQFQYSFGIHGNQGFFIHFTNNY